MTDPTFSGAVVLLGCGRLGSAILEGWLATDTVRPAELTILTPSDKPASDLARERGAKINPPAATLGTARALVLAVKPAKWREALTPLLADLPADLVIVSVMAGVKTADIAALSQRPVARIMPTTAVSQARGVAALWSSTPDAAAVGRALFTAIADVVEVEQETQMDAATAVAGSAPAFIYAFVEGLARAGEARGLSPEAARRLASGALRSAGAGADTVAGLDALIARIASPGGTTRAGLDAMEAGGDLDRATEAAVNAAVNKAREISG